MNNDFYCPLILGLTLSEVRHDYDPHSVLPAHKLVIEPILENCIEAFVYGLKKESDLYKNNAEILLIGKGKFKLDTSKECIKRHEFLWNVTGWKRGSIVVVLEDHKINFRDLFKSCYRPGLCTTPNAGNSLSATKKCKEEAARNNIAICFSASNGIEWMQLYATPKLTKILLIDAMTYCQEREYYSKK